MSVIWKYPITPGESNHPMPSGATPLSVGAQGGAAFVWMLVDPKAAMVDRRIVTVGTGHGFDPSPGSHFVGTFQMMGGILVFHAFVDPEAGR